MIVPGPVSQTGAWSMVGGGDNRMGDDLESQTRRGDATQHGLSGGVMGLANHAAASH